MESAQQRSREHKYLCRDQGLADPCGRATLITMLLSEPLPKVVFPPSTTTLQHRSFPNALPGEGTVCSTRSAARRSSGSCIMSCWPCIPYCTPETCGGGGRPKLEHAACPLSHQRGIPSTGSDAQPTSAVSSGPADPLTWHPRMQARSSLAVRRQWLTCSRGPTSPRGRRGVSVLYSQRACEP